MASAPPLLLLQDIGLTFGGTPLLESATLSVQAGERLCLVGRNGSGKSTLLEIACGSRRTGSWQPLRAADRHNATISPRSLSHGGTLTALPNLSRAGLPAWR